MSIDADTFQPLPPEALTQLSRLATLYARSQPITRPYVDVQSDMNHLVDVVAWGCRTGQILLEDLEIANSMPMVRAFNFIGKRASARNKAKRERWQAGSKPPWEETDDADP